MQIQSENMSQDEFIRMVLERDARNIYRAQQLIVSEGIWREGRDLKAKNRGIKIGKRTGTLERSLSNPNFFIQSEGENFNMILNYPLHIRFLDMRHLGNWKIYRHPIWGIIYNHTIPDIKYKYGQAVADTVGDSLREAFEKYNK